MIWHIVRFDFTGIDDAVRDDIESQLAALDGLDEVAWLRLGHDVEDPHVTGLITAFRTADDLEAYRVHPEHVPVVAAIQAADVAVTRIDMETDDDPDDLPED